jgi:GNAT superfamily N-acetyltransferase
MSTDHRSISCRRPVLADAPQLAQVATSAWRVGFRGLLPQPFLDGLDPARSRDRWEADLSAERVAPPHFLVAQMHAVVCGFSVFGPSRDEDAGADVAELFALHVMPSCWGLGVGSTLLRRTLAQLRAQGSVAASLWVIDGNTRARRFYEHQGWSFDGSERTTARISESPLRELRYRRSCC